MRRHQQTTFVRLLEPDQRFRDGQSYTVVRIETLTQKDETTVVLGDKIAPPMGKFTTVKVWVKERNTPIIYMGDDRVSLI